MHLSTDVFWDSCNVKFQFIQAKCVFLEAVLTHTELGTPFTLYNPSWFFKLLTSILLLCNGFFEPTLGRYSFVLVRWQCVKFSSVFQFTENGLSCESVIPYISHTFCHPH